MIVNPTNIGFIEWTDTLSIGSPSLFIPVATSEFDWKKWVLDLLTQNKLNQVPLPENFSSWRDWADCFVLSL